MSTIKVRAKAKDGIIAGKALIKHPMDSGLRKNKKGEIIPGHYITQLSITNSDTTLLTANWGPAVSKDPYIAFNFAGKSGDQFTVSWVDNKGETDSKDVTVK